MYSICVCGEWGALSCKAFGNETHSGPDLLPTPALLLCNTLYRSPNFSPFPPLSPTGSGSFLLLFTFPTSSFSFIHFTFWLHVVLSVCLCKHDSADSEKLPPHTTALCPTRPRPSASVCTRSRLTSRFILMFHPLRCRCFNPSCHHKHSLQRVAFSWILICRRRDKEFLCVQKETLNNEL